MADRYVEYMHVSKLVTLFHPDNPKDHDLDLIRESMERFGYTEAVMLDERSGYLAAGHGRVELLAHDEAEGAQPPDDIKVDESGWLAPVQRGWHSANDDELLAYVIASNYIPEAGGWVNAGLADALEKIKGTPYSFKGVGLSQGDLDRLRFVDEPVEKIATRKLTERFLVPPFSVLDARQGYWQERKRSWISLGIKSEEGRVTNALVPGVEQDGSARQNAGAYGASTSVAADGSLVHTASVGITSIFDPVLCELSYRWWCPEGGRVVDPFAGGSVRGVVAQRLGLNYFGVDLRGEQVAANRQQGQDIRGTGAAIWEVGDSTSAMFPEADFIFTCPPYYNLERYGDDPADLANRGSYEEFYDVYSFIIGRVADRLRDNRFATVVVGEVRDESTGKCVGLVPDTVSAFEDAGLALYNEAILVTPVGSLAVRAARIFGGSRKLAKGHQNVLTFVKGDPQLAANICAPFDVVDIQADPKSEAPLTEQEAVDAL